MAVRRPGGMSLIPWSQGRAVIWDVTIHDTLAPSYIKLSSSRAGAVADNASGQKRRLCHDLSSLYHLIPIAETMGVFSNECRSFVKDLARRIRLQNNDSSPYLSLCQRISVIDHDVLSVCLVAVLNFVVIWVL